MTRFNREDSRTVLPQLEKDVDTLKVNLEKTNIEVNDVKESNETKLETGKIQHGITDPVSVASSSYVDIEITFNKEFDSVPTVVCCLYSTSTSADIGSISATVYSISTSGFTCRLFNNSAGSRMPAVSWIATDA